MPRLTRPSRAARRSANGPADAVSHPEHPPEHAPEHAGARRARRLPRRAPAASTPPARPLLVTAAHDVVDRVLRLAAGAGAELDVAAGPVEARPVWSAAPLVLVAVDAVDPLGGGLRLPRRADVVLLGSDETDPGLWRRAVDIGAERVVVLPDGDAWLSDRLADVCAGGAPPSEVLGVVGGRGGAGASVLAVALAATAAATGLRPALADLDPLGGGLDLLLGAEERPGLRWSDLAGTRGRLAPVQLREALPEQAGIRLVSFVRGSAHEAIGGEAVGPVLDALRRGHDLVVADLARSVAEPTVASALELCSTVLVVVPAEVRAVAAAGVVAGRVRRQVADVGLVVRGPAPGGLTATEIADALDLPLLGTIPTEPGLAEALERGEPPGREGAPLARACRRLLDAIPGVPLASVA